jgi:hypothetical protein
MENAMEGSTLPISITIEIGSFLPTRRAEGRKCDTTDKC